MDYRKVGDVFEFNYDCAGNFGPTDTKIGTYAETEEGDIEIKLSYVPGSGKMIVRRRNASLPQNG